MKLTLEYSVNFEPIAPEQLGAYLQANGWSKDGYFLDNATVWHLPKDEGEEFEILLPLKTSLGDYETRIREAILTLAEVEKRNPLELLKDLMVSASNIQLQGMVIALAEDESKVKVNTLGVVLGKLRQVEIELDKSEADLAIKAYRERLPIICQGDLIKEGDRFIVNNPQKFALDNI